MRKNLKLLIAGSVSMALLAALPAQASLNQADKTANTVPLATAINAADIENLAVCQVSDFVNVRQEPNTGSAVTGKIYNNCAASILETVAGENGEWYKIQSGTVTGYIKAQYFITGDAAESLARQIGKEFAAANTADLKLYEQADLGSKVLTQLTQGTEYIVLVEEGDFYKLAVDGDLTGYVAQDQVSTVIRFDQALSLQEEDAKKQEEQQRHKDAEEAITALNNARLVEVKNDNPPAANGQGAQNVNAPLKAGSSNQGNAGQLTPIGPGGLGGAGGSGSAGNAAVASATRTAIIAYAKQYLGYPYVYGGTDLNSGTDCSGFTQAIFANFGVATGRSSRDQAVKGRTIAVADVQPGDLLFYASGDYINHVAIYIGGGEVIHSSNPRTGVTISPANYRTPSKAVTFLE